MVPTTPKLPAYTREESGICDNASRPWLSVAAWELWEESGLTLVFVIGLAWDVLKVGVK